MNVIWLIIGLVIGWISAIWLCMTYQIHLLLADLLIKLKNLFKKKKLTSFWYKWYVAIMIPRYIKQKRYNDKQFYNMLDYAVGDINEEIKWITRKQYEKYEQLYKDIYKR